MKICFSAINIKTLDYTWSWTSDNPAPDRLTSELLEWAKKAGFDGFELEDHWVDFYSFNPQELKNYKQLLKKSTLPVPCLKVIGKNLYSPSIREEGKKKLLQSLDIADALDIRIISVNFAADPSKIFGIPKTDSLGKPKSFLSSRDASEDDFKMTAESMQIAAQKAKKLGIEIDIEIHQNSIADSAKSTIKILDMIGEDNVRVNPDLGNIIWVYDEPEEDWQDSINMLTTYSGQWWHCKNITRLHVPEVKRSIFVKGTLDRGEIDYRYALSVMKKSNWDGYILIEGGASPDVLDGAKLNLAYLNRILPEI